MIGLTRCCLLRRFAALFFDWQTDGECTALMLCALNSDTPAVQIHKLVDDIEANSHATNVLIICIAGTVKTLKQVRDILG